MPPSVSCGSSPLTRGARSSLGAELEDQGLIPAHAGSTTGVGALVDVYGAHPRSRGEHDLAKAYFTTGDGSSPLTRGAR